MRRSHCRAGDRRSADIEITRNTTDAQGMFIRVERNAGDGDIKGFEAEATLAPALA